MTLITLHRVLRWSTQVAMEWDTSAILSVHIMDFRNHCVTSFGYCSIFGPCSARYGVLLDDHAIHHLY